MAPFSLGVPRPGAGSMVRPEARDEGLVRPRRASTAAVGERSWTWRAPSRDLHSRVSFSSVVMEASVSWTETGDCCGVTDEHIVVLTVLRVGQFGGVGCRLSLCLLEAALDVLERYA